MIENPKIKIITNFVEELRLKGNFKNTLYCGYVPFINDISLGLRRGMTGLFEIENETIDKIKFLDIKNIDKEKKYDYIIGDLPLNMKHVKWKDKYNIKENYAYMLDLMNSISKDGLGLFNVTESFWYGDGIRFREILYIEEGDFRNRIRRKIEIK